MRAGWGLQVIISAGPHPPHHITIDFCLYEATYCGDGYTQNQSVSVQRSKDVIQGEAVSVPDVRGLSRTGDEAVLQAAHLRFIVNPVQGDGDTVRQQSPNAGAVAPADSDVVLTVPCVPRSTPTGAFVYDACGGLFEISGTA